MATSYANSGGTGARSSIVTVTSNKIQGGGLIANLVDGDLTAGTTHSFFFNNGESDVVICFDFTPSGFKQVIDEFKWYQDVTSSHGTWHWEGFDGAAWTDIANFTLGGVTTQTQTVTNSTAYIAYRLRQTAGSVSSGSYNKEIEFKIEAGAAWTAATTSYANTGGTGARTGIITATYTGTFGAGTAPKFVDGSSANDLWWNASEKGKVLQFDFGASVSKVINELTWKQSNSATHGIQWMEGSNDGSTWTQISGFFLTAGGATGFGGGATTAWPFTMHNTGWRYYRLHGPVANNAGATSGSPFLYEAEFKIANFVVNTNAAWASTEAADVFAGTAGLVGGTWGSVEAKDVFSGAGGIVGAMTWASIEAPDVFAGVAGLVGGQWSSTEAKDLMSATGYPALLATWASTEAKDTFAFSGHNLAIDGFAHNGSATSSITSGTVTLTTTKAHDVIVLCIATSGGTVSSVDDVAGLVWTKRTGFHPTTNATFDMEIWWAHAPAALTADVITIHFSTTNGYAVEAFGVVGANTGAPFDTHNANSIKNDVSSGNVSAAITTDFTGSQLIFGFHSGDAGAAQVTSVATGLTTYLDHDANATLAPHAAVGYALKGSNQTALSCSFTQNGGPSGNRYLMLDAIVSQVDIIGALAATESKDLFAGAGYPQLTGSWHSTEAQDLFAGTGLGPLFGTWGSTEARDVFAAAGIVNPALGIDSHATGGAFAPPPSGSATSASVTLTTNFTNDVIVLGIVTGGFWAFSTVSSITDTVGLVWKKRHQRKLVGAEPNTEIWWAKKATVGPITITVHTGNTGFICIDALAIKGANPTKPFDTHTGAGWYNDGTQSLDPVYDGIDSGDITSPAHTGNPSGHIYTNTNRTCLGLAFYGSSDVPTDGTVSSGWTFLDAITEAEYQGRTGRLASAYQLFSGQQFGTPLLFGKTGGSANFRSIMQDVIVSAEETVHCTNDGIRFFFDGSGQRAISVMSGAGNSHSLDLVTYNENSIAVLAIMIQSTFGARVDGIVDTFGVSGWQRRSIVTDDTGNTSLEVWWAPLPTAVSGTITVVADSNIRPGDIIGFTAVAINGPDEFLRGSIWDGHNSLPHTNDSTPPSYQTDGPFSTVNDHVLEINFAANTSTDPTGFNKLPWLQYVGDFFSSSTGILVSAAPAFNIAIQYKFSEVTVANDTAELDVSPAPDHWMMIADAMPVGQPTPPTGVWDSTDTKDYTTHTGNFTAIGIASPLGWVGCPEATAIMAAIEAKDRTTNPGNHTAIWDTNGWIGFIPLHFNFGLQEAKDISGLSGWVIGPTTILARMNPTEARDRLGFANDFTWYTTPDSKGDRTSRIIVTTNAVLTGGTTPDNLVDGVKANGTANVVFVADAQPAAMWFKFDFQDNTLVNEAMWFQNGVSAQPGNWIWRGSFDDAAWTVLSAAPFVLNGGNGGSVIGDFSSNATHYRYYQLLQTSNLGGNNLPQLWEIEFKVGGISGVMAAGEAKDRWGGNGIVIPTAAPLPARHRMLLIVS